MLPCEFGSPISHSPSKMINQAAAEADEDGDRDNGHDISPIHFRTGYMSFFVIKYLRESHFIVTHTSPPADLRLSL